MSVLVQSAPFDPAAELAAFDANGAGAVVSFTGVVRGDGGLVALDIEHWPGATEAALGDMAASATTRFGLLAVRIVHRHGPMAPGEPIMMVLTAARHRQAAFDGAAWLMDWLKSRAPFWKRESFADGRSQWVAARDEDEAALGAWGDPA